MTTDEDNEQEMMASTTITKQGRPPQCCICLEDMQDMDEPRCPGVRCSSPDGPHFTCVGCLTTYVETKCRHGESSAAAAAWKARRGDILCPMSPDCGVVCTHLTCTSAPFSAHELARALPPAAFDGYLRSKEAFVESVAFDKLVSKYGGVVKDSHQLLVERIKRSNPDARQCPACSYGPLIHSHCDDLMAHHGDVVGRGADGSEVVISNACPTCGYLGREWLDYPPWCVRAPPSLFPSATC